MNRKKAFNFDFFEISEHHGGDDSMRPADMMLEQ